MLKKIKNNLFNNKLIGIFLCLFIFLILFFPFKNTKAFIIEDIMAPLETALEGEEEEVGPVTLIFLLIFFFYALNLIFLGIASSLLQYTLDHYHEWLVIQNSPLVQAGWHFTAGLANLLLILIFLIIAISFILKIETFQARKSLVKLIIVALLMNFSLVFIGILVDISNIAFNTILKAGGGNFVLNVVNDLLNGGWTLIISLMAWIIALVIAFSIPVTAPFAQLGFGIFMVSANLPTVIAWIFQIIIFMMMGGLFLTYAFLFGARAFVIQLLAALSPLAFVCLILPQTEKYWREWLRILLGWITLGLIVLLFLVIGSKISAILAPPGIYAALLNIPIVGYFALLPVFSYYFFVFVFLAIVLWLSRKTMPAMADFMIAQATAMSQMAWSRVIKPVGSALREQYRSAAIEVERREKLEEKGEKLTRGERIGLAFGKVTTRPLRWYYQRRGVGVEAEARGEIRRMVGEFEKKGYTADELAKLAPSLNSIGRAAAALRIQELEGDKGLRRLRNDIFEDATKTIYTLGSSQQRKAFRKFARFRIEENPELQRFVDTIDVEINDIARLIKDRVKIEGRPVEELWRGTAEDRAKVIREAARRNAIESLKAEDYEKILPETAERFKESIVRYGRERRGIGRMLEKGILDWREIEAEIRRLGTREVAKTNAPIILFSYTPYGRSIGASIPRDERGEEIPRSEMQRIISEQRERFLDWETARRIAGEVPLTPPPPPPQPPPPPPGRPGPGPTPGRPPPSPPPPPPGRPGVGLAPGKTS